jgi:hypothetical protein
MDQFDAVAVLDEYSEDIRSAAPACPLCNESLLVLSGLVRCPRCGLMLCESCDGSSGS